MAGINYKQQTFLQVHGNNCWTLNLEVTKSNTFWKDNLATKRGEKQGWVKLLSG